MNNLLNTIAQNILQKNFDTCGMPELQNLADKYPYSSAIQLLYAEKLKEDKNDAHAEQWEKTLLLFNNPIRVNHLFLHNNNNLITGAIISNEVLTTNGQLPEYNNTLLPGSLNNDTGDEVISTHITLEEESPKQFFNANNTVNLSDEVHENTQDFSPIIQEPVITIAKEAQTTEVQVNNLQSSFIETNDQQLTQGSEEPHLTIPGLKIEPIDPKKHELTFTPYYTVDYFASQGIKIEDVEQKDKFSSQLKNFTDWLKQMKRLPEAKSNLGGISPIEEKRIENMAQQSVSGEMADTEAMAEVWVKQSNIQKAIEAYQKLSLQNPSKSAYFAAKIEHLKKSL